MGAFNFLSFQLSKMTFSGSGRRNNEGKDDKNITANY